MLRAIRRVLSLSAFGLGGASCTIDGSCPSHGPAMIQRKMSTGISVVRKDDVRVAALLAQNPNATRDACMQCVEAEVNLTVALSEFAAAEDEYATAQEVARNATEENATCTSEVASCTVVVAEKKASVLQHFMNIEAAVATDASLDELHSLLTAWRTEKDSCHQRSVMICPPKAQAAADAVALVASKKEAVATISATKTTADTAAATACASMRSEGYTQAPTEIPTEAPTEATQAPTRVPTQLPTISPTPSPTTATTTTSTTIMATVGQWRLTGTGGTCDAACQNHGGCSKRALLSRRDDYNTAEKLTQLFASLGATCNGASIVPSTRMGPGLGFIPGIETAYANHCLGGDVDGLEQFYSCTSSSWKNARACFCGPAPPTATGNDSQ